MSHVVIGIYLITDNIYQPHTVSDIGARKITVWTVQDNMSSYEKQAPLCDRLHQEMRRKHTHGKIQRKKNIAKLTKASNDTCEVTNICKLKNDFIGFQRLWCFCSVLRDFEEEKGRKKEKQTISTLVFLPNKTWVC